MLNGAWNCIQTLENILKVEIEWTNLSLHVFGNQLTSHFKTFFVI